VLKFDPEATIERWNTPENVPCKDSSYHEHLREGMRSAGLARVMLVQSQASAVDPSPVLAHPVVSLQLHKKTAVEA
jgi:hypothetical protein